MELNEHFDGLAVDFGETPAPALVPARRAILVVGSHRSGTSALARVLSLVGCDLPKHVLPPHGDNALGFWEPETLVHAHDAFLASIGTSWDDVAALPDGAFVSSAALELRQQLALLLAEEYGTSPLFVVKDPRISRLLPLWFAVLAEGQVAPAIAVTVRNPLEVAASLKARDGFTTTKSLLVWLRHTLESEQHSRGRPRSIVLYDELLRDWQGVLARAGEDLGVTWPGRSHRATVEVENFLSERQRHHVFDWSDLEGRADVVTWVKEAYFALRGSDPVRVLDQVRDELAQADIAFGPLLEEVRLELHASREQTLEIATARDALAEDVEARGLALERRAAEVARLQEELGELNSAMAASASQAATQQAEILALHAERDQLAHEVERMGVEASRLTDALEAAQRRVDAADAGAASTREELTAAYTELGRLRADAEQAVSRAAAIEASSSAERGKLMTELEAARAKIELLEERTASADAALGVLETQAATDRRELLQALEQARADAEQLTARLFATESEVAVERSQLLADLDAANAKADRLAKQLRDKSLDTEELARTADGLLSAADAELAASRAEQDRLQAEVANKVEDQAQRLILVEHLEAALERATAALGEHAQEATAAAARESAARQAEFDAERARLVNELEAARTDRENARYENELVHNELQVLKSEAADERATFIAEREAARTEKERLVAELETARTHGERLSTDTANFEAALEAHRALLRSLQSVTKRRALRRRSLSQFGSWLLPPTPRKLTYLRRYMSLRRSGEFDVDSYLLANPDVLAAGIDPLMHYAEHGLDEGRIAYGGISQSVGSATAEPIEIEPATQEQNKALEPHVGWLEHDRVSTADSVELVAKRAVLILSGCPGDAKRYRADHQAEQASMLGMTCDALVVGEIPFESILEQYRCVILHRVAWDASVERLLADAKSAGVRVLFDTDDLVFDPDAINHVAALEEMGEDDRRLYLSGLHRYRRTLANTDGVIVSTDRLAQEASVVNGVVGLAYNAVSAEMVELSDEARSTASLRASTVTIAYLSGTPTHNRDFAEAADALLRVLEAHPQVRFVAVGHIDLDKRFDRFAGQVDRVPLQPWRSLPSILAGVDVNLAPLERDNPFTDSKSCLKYIEAGLVGVPTIASPRRDFVRAIRHGSNGLMADSPNEWQSALELLVADPAERAAIGARAAADVREHHTTAARARAFHRTLAPLARAASHDAPLAVDWVVRAPLPRTGGYRTIFRLASFLAERGHPTRMYVEQIAHLEGMSQSDIEAFLQEHFGELPFTVIAGHAFEPADITFATNWPTAEPVASHPASLFKAYLVQDFEPEFYEQGDPVRNLAQQSYDLPLRHICYGERLATRLQQETNKPADTLGFALEPEFRLQRPPAERAGPRRVLFFAKPDQPRRGYAIGVEALRLLYEAEPDVEIVLFGSEAELLGELPFPCQTLGSITTDELAAALNSAHILLSLSLTNISHAPYEAMASGCAVVEARTPAADPSLRDRENCVLADPDPAALASALVELVRDDRLRLLLSAAGLETTAGMTWEKTGLALERLLLDWAFLRLDSG